MPESVRFCPFHMPLGIPYNLTGDLLAYPTIDKRSLHNSITTLFQTIAELPQLILEIESVLC